MVLDSKLKENLQFFNKKFAGSLILFFDLYISSNLFKGFSNCFFYLFSTAKI